MKIRNVFSRLVCFAFCILIAVSSLTTFAAKAKADIYISSKKYSAVDKKYVSKTEFDLAASDEKIVYIPVSVETSSTVGGFGFALSYDKEILEFSEGSSFLSLKDENGSVTTHSVSDGIIVLWETIADNIYSNGEFYYAAFKIKSDLKENKTTAVSVAVKQIYDGTDKQVNIIPTVTVKTVNISIKVNFLTQDELAPFEKLKDIVYPDSSADIRSANDAFNALSSAKKEQLKSDYSELYNYYSTAQSRYNRLAEEAGEKAVKDELNAYITKHSQVWKLTVDTVELGDKQKVTAAKSEKDALSSRAKELLGKKYTDLINELLSAIEALEEANEEVADFKANYGNLDGLSEKSIAAGYDGYIILLDEALLVYETLGDEAKQILLPMAESMKKSREIAQKYIDADESAKEIVEKVNEFQKKWLDVLMKNSSNVTLGDETAIKIMLKEYEGLDEDTKNALSSRMAMFQNLLTVIEGMKTADNQQNSGSTTPSGGTTTITQTVVEEKTNTIDKLIYLTKSNVWFLIVLLILLFITIVSFLLPFILRVWQRKKTGFIDDETEETTEEEME
ncbi:MAG: hypothetical protein J6J39_01220 [Clostridia bacterium]|nr:hypothetical protein [Clostridia bacterium]